MQHTTRRLTTGPNLGVVEAAKVVKRRVAARNKVEDAEVLPADTNGAERIRLIVDSKDNARIEIMDQDGAVVFVAPPRPVAANRLADSAHHVSAAAKFAELCCATGLKIEVS